MKELKYTNRDLRKADREVFKLVQDVIKTKRRDGDGKVLQKRTGNLLSNIKPVFKVKGGELYVDIKVMEYYQYLDEGTKRIQPWFLTEEIMGDPKMGKIIKDLIGEATKRAYVELISDINKQTE
jgi:hypothetical protein